MHLESYPSQNSPTGFTDEPFFKRPNKSVYIEIEGTTDVVSLNEPVDQTRALETLRKFSSVERHGWGILPKPEKCHSCEFNKSCVFSSLGL